MRSFLGLSNYFKRFVSKHSEITAPLVKLCDPDSTKFELDDLARDALSQLKELLTNAPILAIPDDTLPYELICDASGFGCGAVLPQNERPIAFWSCKMNPAETRYHAGEQELLAVVKALEHFRPYIEGAVHLTVITDHRPNVTLYSRPHSQLSGRQVRWLQFLSRFCIQWEWRKGISNIADPLSRIPCLNSFTASQMQTPSDQLLDEIQEAYVHDPYFKDSRKTRQLSFDGSYWRRKTSIVVPNYSGLREQCIRLHHDLPYSGHLGRDRTLDLISRHYWWPGIYTDVSHYANHCDQCQRNKVPAQKLPGLLQPLEIPGHKWESVSTDLITQLPETTKGHTAIVCFVDKLTKMVHLAATVTTIDSKEFVHLFMKEVLAKHGLPRTIVSDRDTRFTSEFFRDVCRYLQIERSMSTAFHPQSDGQTERSNRFVKDRVCIRRVCIRAYCSGMWLGGNCAPPATVAAPYAALVLSHAQQA